VRIAGKRYRADSGAIAARIRMIHGCFRMGEDESSLPKLRQGCQRRKSKERQGKSDINAALPMEEVATPGYKTIEEVCGYLKINPVNTLKPFFIWQTMINSCLHPRRRGS
jgi:hypothetical protein